MRVRAVPALAAKWAEPLVLYLPFLHQNIVLMNLNIKIHAHFLFINTSHIVRADIT
jgi:hypothetical protein